MRTYGLAWLTLGATLLMVLAGGLVHATGSALACPDWPLCYGSALPAMEQGVFYEHSHRLIGGVVGLLTAILAAALIRTRWRADRSAWRGGWVAYGLIVVQVLLTGWLGALASRSKLDPAAASNVTPLALLIVAGMFAAAVVVLAVRLGRRAGWLPAVGLGLGELVVFQATLGGVTVLLRLPTAVSTAHLATSMIYLAGVIVTLFVLAAERRGRATAPVSIDVRSGARWASIAAAVVYVQMLLGALVRHTGAGLACNVDLVTCNGALLPEGGPALLLTSHRLFALVVAAVVIAAGLRGRTVALRAGRAGAARVAVALPVLILVQIVLGVLTVSSYVSVGMATAHLGTGALLFSLSVALTLALGPLGAPGAESVERARDALAGPISRAMGRAHP